MWDTVKRWAELADAAVVSEQDNTEKQADFKLKTAFAASATVEMQRLEKLQSYTHVTAPFNGTVMMRNFDSGDLIASGGGKELFRLAQTQKLRVFVQVPQPLA